MMNENEIDTVELVPVATGLKFPEGPVSRPDGSVIVVEIEGQQITQISPDGAKTVICRVPGGPNGAAIGPDGALYICNNGHAMDFATDGEIRGPTGSLSSQYTGGSIQRVDLRSGDITTIHSHFNGKPLLAPNDLVFDKAGGLWFTDHGFRRDMSLQLGALYYASIDGQEIRCVRKSILSPNGVGLSPDETTVYFADTRSARLYRCPLAGPGRAVRSNQVPGEVVATLPGNVGLDSLAVMADGSVCVATVEKGGIAHIDGDKIKGWLRLPDHLTTNICFGGDDMRTAWITCSGTGYLYMARWPIPGLRPNFWDR